jgi:hypothetical protein
VRILAGAYFGTGLSGAVGDKCPMTPSRLTTMASTARGSILSSPHSPKMARSFLRHIRVDSLEDLKQRILAGID